MLSAFDMNHIKKTPLFNMVANNFYNAFKYKELMHHLI